MNQPSHNDSGRQNEAMRVREEKTAVLTSSSSDDGNNSSGDSEKMDGERVSDTTSSETNGSNYKDWSYLKADAKTTSTSKNQQSPASKEPTFPVKLHMILSNPEFQDIITFLPHGRSFRILQQKAFEDKVIPLYFRHGRYSSFARQVNGWNFKRVTSGPDFNSYYHELFLRGMPHLCHRMKRLTAKDIKDRSEQDVNIPAPDFYAVSRKHPLPENTPVSTHQAIAFTRTPPAFAQGRSGASSELDLVEQRRKEILSRINLLSAAQDNHNVVPQAQPSSNAAQALLRALQCQANAPTEAAPVQAPAPTSNMSAALQLIQTLLAASQNNQASAPAPNVLLQLLTATLGAQQQQNNGGSSTGSRNSVTVHYPVPQASQNELHDQLASLLLLLAGVQQAKNQQQYQTSQPAFIAPSAQQQPPTNNNGPMAQLRQQLLQSVSSNSSTTNDPVANLRQQLLNSVSNSSSNGNNELASLLGLGNGNNSN